MPGALLYQNISVVGYSVSALVNSTPHLVAETAQRVIKLVAEGVLKLPISEIFPLEQPQKRTDASRRVRMLVSCSCALDKRHLMSQKSA